MTELLIISEKFEFPDTIFAYLIIIHVISERLHILLEQMTLVQNHGRQIQPIDNFFVICLYSN